MQDSGSTSEALGRTKALPREIGGYRIVRELGHGGMGVVYEAEQQNPRRPVALKVIRSEKALDEISLKLFRREVATLARLRHPGIAAIYESGQTAEGQHFFAMELVRGPSLGEWIRAREGQFDSPAREVRLRLGIFRQICDAVSYAHQRGVIHRDLKPGNVMLVTGMEVPSGDVPVPSIKILDFGLARITDSDLAATTLLSEVGRIAGTLPYMSPEQVRGNPDEIDLRTDVYSLGVLLFELLTGQLPYEIRGAMVHEVIRVISEDRPSPLSNHWFGSGRPDRDLETIVQKALEKGPARRYQGVSALWEDIDRYLSGYPILARPPSAGYQLQKLVARHKVGFFFSCMSVLLLALFAVTMTIQAKRIAAERDRARFEARLVAIEGEAFYALFREDNSRGIELLRQALALHRESLGNTNPDLVPHLYKVAGVLDLFGSGGPFGAKDSLDGPAEIEALDREALDIRQRAYPPLDPRIMESAKILADAIVRREPDKADSLYAFVLASRIRIGQSRADIESAEIDHADALKLLGAAEANRGEFPSAEKHLRESVTTLTGIEGAHPELVNAELLLGRCLSQDHRFGEAESVLARALVQSRQIRDSGQSEARSLQFLAELYQGENPERAATFRAKAKQAREHPPSVPR